MEAWVVGKGLGQVTTVKIGMENTGGQVVPRTKVGTYVVSGYRKRENKSGGRRDLLTRNDITVQIES